MQTYEITFNERTKVGKTLLSFLDENKKQIKVKDPTKMTKEEHMQMLRSGTGHPEQLKGYPNKERWSRHITNYTTSLSFKVGTKGADA